MLSGAAVVADMMDFRTEFAKTRRITKAATLKTMLRMMQAMNAKRRFSSLTKPPMKMTLWAVMMLQRQTALRDSLTSHMTCGYCQRFPRGYTQILPICERKRTP